MDTASLQHNNKQRVADYYASVWNAKDLAALERFVDRDYVQHNPKVGNGRAALADFLAGLFQAVPQGRFEIARLIAESDLVVAHTLFRAHPGDRGTVVIDIYRLEGGMLVEHWDVKEAVPEETVNGNAMV